MHNPKINQCMSCKFFRMTTKSDYTCFHWNANDPDGISFCYDYECIEDEGIASEDSNIKER